VDDSTNVNVREHSGTSQFPFGGDVSDYFFRCEAARLFLYSR
jgi:hypothetical protein